MAGAVEHRIGRFADARALVAHYRTPLPATTAVPDRLAGLDILRLVAALAVVAFHFGYAGPMRGGMTTSFPELAGLAKYGFLGVDLFFLISGYVITASAFGRSWHAFAISRLLRLYPAHVVSMTATAIVLAILGGAGTPVTIQQWLANLTMVAPALGQPFMDGAYWSIVIEIVFYGGVGVLVAAGLFERRLLAIIAVWLAVACLNEVLIHSRVIRLGLCTEYAGLFASGILIQRIRAGERNLWAWLLLGAAFGLGLMHAFENIRTIARLYGDTLGLARLWAVHVGIYAVFIGGLWASRFMPASRTVLTIGGLTYPLYLVHQQAGYSLIDALAPMAGRWMALIAVIALALAFSFAVLRWVEPAGRQLMRAVIASIAHIGSVRLFSTRRMQMQSARASR